MNRVFPILIIVIIQGSVSCTTSSHFTNRFYSLNKQNLHDIRERYQKAYNKRAFHIQFKDKTFRYLAFEILTDSLRYIYNFDLKEPFLADTLDKYKYEAPEIIGIIADMQAMRCTWISTLAYFEDDVKKELVFVSVRDSRLQSFFNGEKYYALAFFNEPQVFDNRGRLIDRGEKKRLREINGSIFRRIDDKVCYAITGTFR